MGALFSKPKTVQAATPVAAAVAKTPNDTQVASSSSARRKAAFGINDTFIRSFAETAARGKNTLGA